MGERIEIEGSKKGARMRPPLMVLLLTVITIGIYAAFWWYFANREMRDLGVSRRTNDLGTEPAISTLAFTLGSLVFIPVVWTAVTTTRRVQRAQKLTGPKRLNGWVAAFFLIFTWGFAAPTYLQSELNKVWKRIEFQQQQGADAEGGGAGASPSTES